jgi:hypothetical protein
MGPADGWGHQDRCAFTDDDGMEKLLALNLVRERMVGTPTDPWTTPWPNFLAAG